MMIIIIILTASYIGDDVRIVYSLANTMRSFSVTDGRTNKGILGVGFLQKCRLIRVRQFVPILSLIVSLYPSDLFTSCVVAGG